MALAEDDPVEGGGELQVHRHPALLAGDVQARDLEKFILKALQDFQSHILFEI